MPIRARAADNKVAIYTVPSLASTDNTPLADPNANAARLRFHSDRQYVKVVSTHTGTLVLPQRTMNTQVKVDHALFVHGQPSAPMVFGRISNLSSHLTANKNVPISGSIPVPIKADPATEGVEYRFNSLTRWVGLATDDTTVYLREYGMVERTKNWTPQSINWTVHLTNFLITGPAPTTDPTKPGIRIEAGKVQFGFGKFDTDFRYLRLNASGESYKMPIARHISYIPTYVQNSTSFHVAVEASLAGFNFKGDSFSLPTPTPTFVPPMKNCDV